MRHTILIPSSPAAMTIGAPTGREVVDATLTVEEIALFAAAGAALGAVIATQQKSKPFARNAAIGAVALPVIAVVL